MIEKYRVGTDDLLSRPFLFCTSRHIDIEQSWQVRSARANEFPIIVSVKISFRDSPNTL